MNILGKIAEKLQLLFSYKKGPSIKNIDSLSIGGSMIVGDNNQIKIDNNTPSLTFRMVRHYNEDYSLDRSPFGVMMTLRNPNVNVSSATFLDIGGQPVGRSTTFEVRSSQGELESSYRIDTQDDETRFLRALEKNNGKIKTLVKLDDGRTFYYTFEASTDNWTRVLLDGRKNLEDTFHLEGRT